jgi:serine/threonine-protein kinase
MRGWSRKALVVLALGGAAYGGFRMTRQRPAALQALIPVEPAAPKRIEAYAAKWTRERAVTEKDLAGKTAFQLNVMRFEILARHGYKIDPDRKDVAAFFREAPWYNPQTSRMNKVWDKLSRLERANYRAILQHQRRHGLLK